jgi:hypothetical protein
MISENTKKIIKETFNQLPKIIQDAILDSGWEEKIRRIVEKNNLHIDQGAAIESLVFVTMLGLETPDDFIRNAKEQAEITDEQAFIISREIEREIFSEIREKLIEISEGAEEEIGTQNITDEFGKIVSDIEDRVNLEKEDGYEKIKPKNEYPKEEVGIVRITKTTKPPLSERIPKESFREEIPNNKYKNTNESQTPSLQSQKTDAPVMEEEINFVPVPPVIPKISSPTIPLEDRLEEGDNIIEEKMGAILGTKKETETNFIPEKLEEEKKRPFDPYLEPID